MPRNAAKKLAQLAQAWSEDHRGRWLHRGEAAVVRAAADGERVDLHTAIEPDTDYFDPDHAEEWHKHRVIDPELLVFLMTDAEARRWVHRAGIQLAYARFEKPIDLRSIDTTIPLTLLGCHIRQGASFQESRVAGLTLYRCSLGALPDRFRTPGSLVCRMALIQGNLDLRGSRLTSSENRAFDLQRATVRGYVFMDTAGSGTDAMRFEATGELYMPGCEISGQLSMNGARIDGKGGDALNLQGATVSGGMYLRQTGRLSTILRGPIYADTSAIRGMLDLTGLVMLAQGQTAVSFERATIEADVYFAAVGMASSHFAKVRGGVRMARAHIRGSLNMQGVRIEDQDAAARQDMTGRPEAALDLYDATIDGALRFGLCDPPPGSSLATPIAGQTLIRGPIDLRHAKVGVLADYKMGTRIACTAPRVVGKDWRARDTAPTWLLSGLVYERFESGIDQHWKQRLNWIGHPTEKEYHPQRYEQLTKVLRAEGFDGAAKRVAYAKQQKRLEVMKKDPLKTPSELMRRCWGKFLQHTVGFGYRPWLIFRWVAVLLVLGAGVFGLAERANAHRPNAPLLYSARDQAGGFHPLHPIPDEYTRFDPFLYSLDTMVPFLNIHQEESWRIDGSSMPGAVYRGYEIFHIFGGWMLTTLGVVGFTGILKRD